MEGVPRRILLPAGGVGVLAVVALIVLLVLRPSGPAAVRASIAPSAPPPSHNAVINSFFREVRDPAATFAVTVKATITVQAAGKTTVATVDGDFDVAGSDYSGTLRVAGEGIPPFEGSVRQVGLDGWARLMPSGSWTHRTLPAQADSANPFQWISTVDELTYLAQGADVAGARTHRLETTKWLSGTEYDALALSLVNPDRTSRMEIVVTDAGVPLTATYAFGITGTLPASGTLTLSGTAQYTFSQWGSAITVTPPA